jgi:hypothetical protein
LTLVKLYLSRNRTLNYQTIFFEGFEAQSTSGPIHFLFLPLSSHSLNQRNRKKRKLKTKVKNGKGVDAGSPTLHHRMPHATAHLDKLRRRVDGARLLSPHLNEKGIRENKIQGYYFFHLLIFLLLC